MDCREYEKQISRLVDGELADSAAERLRSHITACSTCSARFERLATLEEDLRRLKSIRPSADLAASVKERLAGEIGPIPEGSLLPSWSRIPVMALIVLIALGLGNLAGRTIGYEFLDELSNRTVELLAVERGPSFADAMIEIGRGDWGR